LYLRRTRLGWFQEAFDAIDVVALFGDKGFGMVDAVVSKAQNIQDIIA